MPSRCSLMLVVTSETAVCSERSVSNMEMERIDSSRVLGISCASVMCSSVVARLSIMICCHSRMRFRARRKSSASIGV